MIFPQEVNEEIIKMTRSMMFDALVDVFIVFL